MKTTTENVQTSQGGRVAKKTVSLTVDQLDEISTNPDLAKQMIAIINGSDGNMKGNMAFEISKAMLKQKMLKF